MTSRRFRSALVTGASSGIGAEIARVLATRGCNLTLVARRADRLETLASELRKAGVTVTVLPADLATEEGLAVVCDSLSGQPVELLVNNAGIGSGGAFVELDPAREADLVRVNVLALQQLTRTALPAMVAAGHGGVLNIGSIAGNQPLAGYATYGATKAFVASFTEALAPEVRRHGVHVTLVKPGYTDTEMTADPPAAGTLRRRLLWLDAPAVARAAVDAVERGRLECVPGATWKATNVFIEALPRPVIRALAARARAW